MFSLLTSQTIIFELMGVGRKDNPLDFDGQFGCDIFLIVLCSDLAGAGLDIKCVFVIVSLAKLGFLRTKLNFGGAAYEKGDEGNEAMQEDASRLESTGLRRIQELQVRRISETMQENIKIFTPEGVP